MAAGCGKFAAIYCAPEGRLQVQPVLMFLHQVGGLDRVSTLAARAWSKGKGEHLMQLPSVGLLLIPRRSQVVRHYLKQQGGRGTRGARGGH